MYNMWIYFIIWCFIGNVVYLIGTYNRYVNKISEGALEKLLTRLLVIIFWPITLFIYSIGLLANILDKSDKFLINIIKNLLKCEENRD